MVGPVLSNLIGELIKIKTKQAIGINKAVGIA